jgi:hypothetical protein
MRRHLGSDAALCGTAVLLAVACTNAPSQNPGLVYFPDATTGDGGADSHGGNGPTGDSSGAGNFDSSGAGSSGGVGGGDGSSADSEAAAPDYRCFSLCGSSAGGVTVSDGGCQAAAARACCSATCSCPDGVCYCTPGMDSRLPTFTVPFVGCPNCSTVDPVSACGF